MQEINDILCGALSSEDEEAVEAELNELISVEYQTAIDMLPTVPSKNLPIIIPGKKLLLYIVFIE